MKVKTNLLCMAAAFALAYDIAVCVQSQRYGIPDSDRVLYDVGETKPYRIKCMQPTGVMQLRPFPISLSDCLFCGAPCKCRHKHDDCQCPFHSVMFLMPFADKPPPY